VYAAAGGEPGLNRLAAAWHARVMADPVVSHAFSHGFHPDHTRRLAACCTAAGSNVPGIGASGAIAGVLAGYLLMYPNSHIDSLLPLGAFYWPTRVPAWVFIGLWFLYQLALSVISLGNLAAGGGVAYSAHVGGFITGLILVRIFMRSERVDVIRARQQQQQPAA
jgi:membrane associated rhomboid family serine protease